MTVLLYQSFAYRRRPYAWATVESAHTLDHAAAVVTVDKMVKMADSVIIWMSGLLLLL
jgi:adenosyl cobinamide kinase/adenosyl cobinamide phosphate guanylyltransferase